MDETFLRRLIGVAVLFGAVFALASWLPESGPAADRGNEPVVSIDLLAPQARQEPSQPSQPAPQLKFSPALQSAETPPAPEPKPPAAVEQKPAPEPGATPPVPPAGAGSWWVQLASYSDWDNAHRALERGQALGYTGTIQSIAVKGKTWYRVRLGPFADGKTAESAHTWALGAGFKDARVLSSAG